MATGLFNLKQVNQAISQGAWSGYIAPRWVEYLVVAGGGGSGNGGASGGGGGAGGLLTGIVTVAAGASYTVTVGAGGAGTAGNSTASGTSSVFGNISTTGGGGGGEYLTFDGKAGGSGGGGTPWVGKDFPPGGQGVSGQGNRGGKGTAQSSSATDGGGGGAGTVGLDATSGYGGNGGAGIASAITGSVVTYAGGGGGGTYANSIVAGGVGGVGGGGSGAIPNNNGTSGGGNTGGGGGGGGNTGAGGSGGSGIVVVRYPGNVQFFTGGTLSYANGYIIHTFYANGTLAPTTPTPYVTDYQISRSLRFNSADSAYLDRTPSSASNRKIWTWSAWVKRGALSGSNFFNLFEAYAGASDTDSFGIRFTPNDILQIWGYNSSWRETTAVYRDASAWYHIVVAVDTTQATANDRIKLYVNGVQVTAFSVTNNPTQNSDTGVDSTGTHYIGRAGYSATWYFSGYQTEVNFIDGQALTPSSFGYTNPATGVWSPLAFVGTYGTNGFYLNFSDNSNTTAATLGKDYSGNGNNWTPNNFSVTAGAGNDSMVDVPTPYGVDTGVGGSVRGNYCTINPLIKPVGTVAYSDGNLVGTNSTSNWNALGGTIGISTGKWYWEYTSPNQNSFFGIMVPIINFSYGNPQDANAAAGSVLLCDDNKYQIDFNARVTYASSGHGTGVIVGVAVDMDAGTIVFYINGTSQGSITWTSSAAYGKTVIPMAIGYDSGTSTTANFGQRPFAYTAPSGFKALCTQNLPTPTIGATTATQAGKFFNPVLYTGNGGTQSVTGVGFQPDFTWVKSRTSTNGNGFEDAVRGAGITLESNNTAAEVNYSAYFTAFTSDGFDMALGGGFFNSNGQNYVAWNWKANGSGSSNTAGSITSTVSANTTSGFSIVTYTGNGSAATVGHGLGVAPSMIICKGRSVGGNYWQTQHSALGPTKALFLNTTDAAFTNAAYWNNTAPTSTVFSLGGNTDANGNGTTYVAYCFAEVAGYSKFGSYTGNGSADGAFIYTGFRPAYVMVKLTNGGNDWVIQDAKRGSFNVNTATLYANASYSEDTASSVDFLSNGFKFRTAQNAVNASGNNYIYMAFAENPFKYSLAR